jgi:hypothetical protein
MYIEGINPARVFEAADLPPAVNAPQPLPDSYGQAFALGTRGRDQSGNSYILLQSPAAIATQGNIGFWDENFLFTLLSTGNDVGGISLAGNFGLPTLAGQRFWALVEGMGPVRVNAAVAADAALFPTATPGALDDVSPGAGAFAVEGLNPMVASGGAASINARYFNPHLDASATAA